MQEKLIRINIKTETKIKIVKVGNSKIECLFKIAIDNDSVNT